MTRKSDERLLDHVQQKLLAHGVRPPCRVTVMIEDGVVKLAGTVQFDYQKRAAVRALHGMSGVKKVMDGIQAQGSQSVYASRKKQWEYIPPDAHKNPHSAS